MGYFNIYGQYVRCDDELYHHGILGMKWGHKNGPPYPLGSGDHSASEEKAGWKRSLDGPSKSEARKYTKALNKEDQRQVEMIGKRNRAAKKATKDLVRYNKIANKYGSDSNKAKKAASKFEKSFSSTAEMTKAIKDSESRTWQTLAKLSDTGYDVTSKKIMRDAARGKRIVAQALGGLTGNVIYSATAGKGTIIEGNKFKVTVSNNEKGSINFDNRDLTKKSRDARKAREDAINDVSAITQIGRQHFDSNAKPGVGNLNGKAGVRNNDLVKSTVGNAVNKKGGIKVSKEYADEYNKTYDEAVRKARNMADNNQLKKPGYVEKAEGRKPAFRTGSKKAVSDANTDIDNKIANNSSKTSSKKSNDDYKKQRHKESIQNQLAKARNDDVFQLDFLEAVQGDDWASSNPKYYNRQKMLSEYKKYLQDPEKYMTTHNVKY